MKRSEVELVLRPAAAITQEHSFVVVGSQAILLPYPHAPEELLVSRELDLLLQRIDQLDAAVHPVAVISEWARRRASEALSA
ncbi:MAG: hypothetical protein V4864_08780 [Pseudomonadota bacterium]